MAEDPTRIMRSGGGPERRPPRGRPPQKPHGNQRLVIAVMGAVIFGLLIALFVGSCSGGGTETVTITTEPEYIEPNQPASPGNEETETPAEEAEAEAEAEAETGGVESEEGEEPTEFELEPEGVIEEPTPEELEGGGEEATPEEQPGGGFESE